MSIDYEQKQVEETIAATGSIVNVVDWVPKNEGIKWSEKDDYVWDNIYRKSAVELFTIAGLSEGEYYLHTSSRNVMEAIREEENVIASVSDWNYPQLARHVYYTPETKVGNTVFGATIEDLKSDAEIEQLNTFNSLTNNGKSDGIYYTENVYLETNDESPVFGKDYYYKETVYEPYIQYPSEEDINEGRYFIYNNEAGENESFYQPATIANEDFNINSTSTDGHIYEFKSDIDYYIKDVENQNNFKKVNVYSGNISTDGNQYYEWKDAVEYPDGVNGYVP
jgi:hypothetical protein